MTTSEVQPDFALLCRFLSDNYTRYCPFSEGPRGLKACTLNLTLEGILRAIIRRAKTGSDRSSLPNTVIFASWTPAVLGRKDLLEAPELLGRASTHLFKEIPPPILYTLYVKSDSSTVRVAEPPYLPTYPPPTYCNAWKQLSEPGIDQGREKQEAPKSKSRR